MKRRGNIAGFTLIEVLVAMTVLSGGILGVLIGSSGDAATRRWASMQCVCVDGWGVAACGAAAMQMLAR